MPAPDGHHDGIRTRGSAVSRRTFLRNLGTTAVSAAALRAGGIAAEVPKAGDANVRAPGPGPLTLLINGESRSFTLEPRTTLLEALRIQAGLTGAKEVCERATCGACTVLLDGMPVYSCMVLAVEAQGRSITTIEGVSREGLTPLQSAIAEHDGLQCGFCTPGFVMSLTALLKANPHPTEADVRKACSGHLCRCGSYPRIFAAALACAEQGRSAASRAGATA